MGHAVLPIFEGRDDTRLEIRYVDGDRAGQLDRDAPGPDPEATTGHVLACAAERHAQFHRDTSSC